MIIVPTIHLNGSSGAALAKGYADAMASVIDALNALAATAPHGRDYYPQDASPTEGRAIRQAMKEHRDRVAALEKVASELEALQLGVQRQVKERV